MLSEDMIFWIKNSVKKTFREADLDEAVEALCQFLDLDEDALNLETSFVEMAEATDLQKPHRIKNFSDIERFMKKLCTIVKPDLMKQDPKPLFAADKNREWMLANMYKEAFEVVDMDFNLKRAEPEQYEKMGYLSAYVRIYKFRNALTHQLEVDLSPENMMLITRDSLVCYLDLCHQYREALQKVSSSQERTEGFDARAFCLDIEARYQKQLDEGFGYIDIHWINREDAFAQECAVSKFLKKGDLTCTKLLGEAGSGKSTALERIEYLMAREYLKGKNQVVPVLLRLNELSDGDRILVSKVAAVLGVSEALADSYLKNGDIWLLLDGFNEVLEPDIKRKLAREMDQIDRYDVNTRIFLTDRAIARASIPTLKSARKMYLCPITMEDKKSYFEKNCTSPEALKLILDKLQTAPEYFELLSTPLKLRALVEIVTEKLEIPEDITGDYIEHLFEREKFDKKDETIEYLPTLLQSLSLLGNDGISYLEACSQLAKCMSRFGFTVPDSNQVLKLSIDMGILIQEEGNRLYFASSEYFEYFYMEALYQNLDSLLEG